MWKVALGQSGDRCVCFVCELSFKGRMERNLLVTHRHKLRIAAASSHVLIFPYGVWLSRALLLRCKQTWMGWTFTRSFLLVIQRYKTAYPELLRSPYQINAHKTKNASQARRYEEMWSTQRMNRLFETLPTYTPTELVMTWSVLVGLVKFVCCVISFLMMHLGFPLFDFEKSFFPESGRLLWRTTTSRRLPSFAGVYFIGFSPYGG